MYMSVSIGQYLILYLIISIININYYNISIYILNTDILQFCLYYIKYLIYTCIICIGIKKIILYKFRNTD